MTTTIFNLIALHRKQVIFPLAHGQTATIKTKMLEWANRFSIFSFLDSNDYPDKYGRYSCLMATGYESDRPQQCSSLEELQALHDERKDWLFGHICYDYKNELEPRLTSDHIPTTTFPIFHFFVPQTVCYISRDNSTLTVASCNDPHTIYDEIIATIVTDKPLPAIDFTLAVTQKEYLQTIEQLRQHIGDGDCYEINFCNKGYSKEAIADPVQIFKSLNQLSPAPFAACYRYYDQYMACASPERYLQKQGSTLLAQPIKGTAKRGKNPVQDDYIKATLAASVKERAENVMIVDLMRNDLSRCCETASVEVPELFGIYTFPQVHQMISTVTGVLKKGTAFADAIRYSFPMGSMTGAPKYKVMQLIAQYERARRELFSGTVGYIDPEGNFDFNVVIRSLFYNTATQYLSYSTGGAITYDSDPQQEWAEMRLKAWSLENIFNH